MNKMEIGCDCGGKLCVFRLGFVEGFEFDSSMCVLCWKLVIGHYNLCDVRLFPNCVLCSAANCDVATEPVTAASNQHSQPNGVLCSATNCDVAAKSVTAAANQHSLPNGVFCSAVGFIAEIVSCSESVFTNQFSRISSRETFSRISPRESVLANQFSRISFCCQSGSLQRTRFHEPVSAISLYINDLKASNNFMG